MACISKYGLHVEAIIFPGGLQQKKTGRSGGEGDRKTIDSLKKRGSGHRCLSMWEDAVADNQSPHPASIWHWKALPLVRKNQ